MSPCCPLYLCGFGASFHLERVQHLPLQINHLQLRGRSIDADTHIVIRDGPLDQGLRSGIDLIQGLSGPSGHDVVEPGMHVMLIVVFSHVGSSFLLPSSGQDPDCKIIKIPQNVPHVDLSPIRSAIQAVMEVSWYWMYV
jgi:hypothetical protein